MYFVLLFPYLQKRRGSIEKYRTITERELGIRLACKTTWGSSKKKGFEALTGRGMVSDLGTGHSIATGTGSDMVGGYSIPRQERTSVVL